MPTINLERHNTEASNRKTKITQVANVPTKIYLTPDTDLYPDVDLLIAFQDTAGAAETYVDVQVTSGESIYFFEANARLVQLNPSEEGSSKEEHSKLEKEALTKAAIEQQNAEWAARLDMQLARAVRGENRIYYSEEEVFAALDDPPSKDTE